MTATETSANPNGDGPKGVDRRAALKKVAAGGAIAWGAPMIVSKSAHAQVAGCTPKCVPVGGGQSTATATVVCAGNGSNRNVTVSIPIASSVLCPCNGENPNVVLVGAGETNWAGATVSVTAGAIVVIQLGEGTRPPLEVNVTITATCTDRSPDDGGCARTCSTTATVPVGLSNNGNCNGVNLNPTATVTTSCN